MNEDIILRLVKPYVKDSAITYGEFNKLFSILSRKEQYTVCDILFNNGIDLVDSHPADDAIILDIDELSEDLFVDDLQIQYDESPFMDKISDNSDFERTVVLNTHVRQSNEILCGLIQQGNQQASQDLCSKNHRLVIKYAIAYEKRYANRLDLEDLEQAGFMGLIKAAQKFDLGLDVAFSTYAVYWIKQAIAREIMEHGYNIKIPVHMMERINKVVAIDNQLADENVQESERISYIADKLSISENNVREAISIKNNYLLCASLDAPIGEDQDSTLGDFIPMDEAFSAEQIVLDKALREELEIAIATLEPREQVIIKLRFGLYDDRPRTLEEIGAALGVTRERIRQIEERALRRLRNRSRRLKTLWEE